MADEAEQVAQGDGVMPLKLKELVEGVAQSTGQRKSVARDVVQATLAALANGLAAGRDVQLPGVGKLKVTRSKQTGRGQAVMIKLVVHGKTSQSQIEAEQALAEHSQDG